MEYESSNRMAGVFVAVCLNCGKEIEPGENLCGDCAQRDQDGANQLLNLGPPSRYKPRRSRNWLVLSVMAFVLAAILFGAGFLLLNAVPTNPKVQATAQANICHHHLQNIQTAINDYYKNTRQYPPAGRLNEKSPLVIDKYLEGVSRCPSTGHQYLIESMDGKYTVICDSGLAGHGL